jgi:hypothetical protein
MPSSGQSGPAMAGAIRNEGQPDVNEPRTQSARVLFANFLNAQTEVHATCPALNRIRRDKAANRFTNEPLILGVNPPFLFDEVPVMCYWIDWHLCSSVPDSLSHWWCFV